MPRYRIEVRGDGNDWTAVIPSLLVAGFGKDAQSAIADAVRQADEKADSLIRAGLAKQQRDGYLRPISLTRLRLTELAAEYAIRAAFLFVVLAGLLLVVRGDLKHEAALCRTSIQQDLAQLRDAVGLTDATAGASTEVLRDRARQINKRLLPVAEELRPLFRALLDDPEPPIRQPPAN